MNCRYVQRHFGDLFDENDPGANPELRRHLNQCADCARDFARVKQALAVPQPVREMRASADFKERVMNKLESETISVRQRWAPRIGLRWGLRLALGAATVAAVIMPLPYLGSIGGVSKSGAVALLAQSVQAMSNLQSVHMIARMRTLPRDNFEGIGLQYDFVPVEIWKQYGDTPRWRVEKPGRVVVMDGTSSTLLIEPNQAARGGPHTGFVEWLMPLMDADKLLESELAAAKRKESQAVLSQTVIQGASEGSRTILLTVNRKAEGDLTNDWLRNKAIQEADHTSIYSFDPANNRLTGLQVFVHDSGKDVLVFEITGIRYNEPLDPKLFTLDLPENVVWAVSPEKMPASSKPLPATPRDAAVAFFEGLAQRDWEQVLAVRPFSLDDGYKKAYGGLQVISIGEPFKSGIYPGWFVPYEVRLASGRVKKHNLAVRNDNREKRYVLDGGF